MLSLVHPPSLPLFALCREEKHSVAEFKAAQPPLSTFLYNGKDYSKAGLQRQQAQNKYTTNQLNKLQPVENDTLKGIGADYWADRKRQRNTRLVEVDGHHVLRENMYSMEEGGISAWKETRQALAGGEWERGMEGAKEQGSAGVSQGW